MPKEFRPSTLEDWINTKRPPAERLVRFESWLRGELVARLEWPVDPRIRDRQVGQCQRFVAQFLCDLNRRGWLFDGPLLAHIITSKIDDIAKRQREGSIEDLWIYFRSVWRQYADAASEKLSAQAMSAGFHISKIMAGLKTIPQVTAERMEQISAEKLSKARKKLRDAQSEEGQSKLF